MSAQTPSTKGPASGPAGMLAGMPPLDITGGHASATGQASSDGNSLGGTGSFNFGGNHGGGIWQQLPLLVVAGVLAWIAIKK